MSAATAEPYTDPAEFLNGAVPATLLRRDLRAAATTLTASEARFLVDVYYMWQDQRIRTAGQVRALTTSAEPHTVISWAQGQMGSLEDDIRAVLDTYTKNEPTGLGRWLRGITGIGPVIAAGLCAHIDITRAPTAGHIWAYAGLNPEQRWKKGEKRPWNAALRVVCWKAGESFTKVSGNKNDVYGKLWLERKRYEWAKNLRGEYAEQARAKLATVKIGDDTQAKSWYSGQRVPCPNWEGFLAQGDLETIIKGCSLTTDALANVETGALVASGVPMLPPGHIHARAKRFATKIFLSHLHHVAYRLHYGTEPPKPFSISILGHVHYMPPPNFETPTLEGWPG